MMLKKLISISVDSCYFLSALIASGSTPLRPLCCSFKDAYRLDQNSEDEDLIIEVLLTCALIQPWDNSIIPEMGLA